MEVGRKYRGYGTLTPYGEFMFEPEATGSHAGREKTLFSSDDVTIKETKNYLVINIKAPKNEDELGLAKLFMGKMNVVFNFLRNYEI